MEDLPGKDGTQFRITFTKNMLSEENESFLKINGFELIDRGENYLLYTLKSNINYLEIMYDTYCEDFCISINHSNGDYIIIGGGYKGDLSYFQELISCFKKYFK
jgi:hypothetical protein